MNILTLGKDTISQWSTDRASTWGAALSYYTIFSLAPLLLLVISILGLVLGQEAVQGKLFAQLSSFLGRDGAQTIQQIISNANKPTQGIVSSILSFVMLMLGASGVFGQLKQALNFIWKVEPRPGRGLWALIRERFLSFSMVLVVCFLLGVSLVTSSLIGYLTNYFYSALGLGALFIESLNFLISFLIMTVLFTLMIKILPDIRLEWNYAWIGGAVTSILFTVGKTLIGLYIGNSAVADTYGAASSIIVLLIWVYYSAQILFLGTEFTKVYMLSKQKDIRPSQYGKTMQPESLNIPTNERRLVEDKHLWAGLATSFLDGFVNRFEMSEKTSKRKNLSGST